MGEAQGEYITNGILVRSTLPKLAIGACQGVEVARALNSLAVSQPTCSELCGVTKLCPTVQSPFKPFLRLFNR